MKNKIIYLDNAATTWPKPKEIERITNKYFKDCFVSPNRTIGSKDFLNELRQDILEYFDADENYDVAFVPSATVGMNIVVQSIVKQNAHIITTNCEHHCVYRPLYSLKANFDVVDYLDANQNEHPEKIFQKINSKTRAVIMNHGSNVTGDILNVQNIGLKLKDKKSIFFVVDVSQTAGFEDISIKKMNADVIVGGAHKHLYGLQGIGYIIYKKSMKLYPIYYGGNGKLSGELEQPLILPEVLETGTFNTVGLLSLKESLKIMDAKTRASSRKHEEMLTSYFLEKVKEIKNIKVYAGKKNKRTGVISFVIPGLNPEHIVGPYLKENGNIYFRSGLHCAPLIHKTIGTFPEGTNRISFSMFTTKDELDVLIKFLKNMTKIK